MDLPVMADSRMDAIINAPCESIDLTAWVFELTDKDYQACSKDHIAAAASFTADGKRMSINVERIGSLLIQHYVENIAERRHLPPDLRLRYLRTGYHGPRPGRREAGILRRAN